MLIRRSLALILLSISLAIFVDPITSSSARRNLEQETRHRKLAIELLKSRLVELNDGEPVEAFSPELCGKFIWPNKTRYVKEDGETSDQYVDVEKLNGAQTSINSLQPKKNESSSRKRQQASNVTVNFGYEALIKQFPSHAVVWAYNNYTNEWKNCWGTVIARHLVLTDANCIPGRQGIIKLRVGLGWEDLKWWQDWFKFTADHETHYVRAVCSHKLTIERPNEDWDNSDDSDLMVVQTQEPITFNEFIQPACLQLDEQQPPSISYDPSTFYSVYVGHSNHNSRFVQFLRYVPVVTSQEGYICREQKYAQNCFVSKLNTDRLCPSRGGSGIYKIVENRQYLVGIAHTGRNATDRCANSATDRRPLYGYDLNKNPSTALETWRQCSQKKFTKKRGFYRRVCVK